MGRPGRCEDVEDFVTAGVGSVRRLLNDCPRLIRVLLGYPHCPQDREILGENGGEFLPEPGALLGLVSPYRIGLL